MSKATAALLGSVIGGIVAATATIFWFGWEIPMHGQAPFYDQQRGDYVDLLLTVVTILLGAVGLTVTVGALAIGFVALKTLREIKDEAATAAKKAAAEEIKETMDSELEPSVSEKVKEALPPTLRAALLNDEIGHSIFAEMAQRGELDEVLERVAMRTQFAGPESDPENDG